VVSFRKVIHNTVDIRFDIFRALDIQMLVGADMQCIGNTEMIPEKLMESGVLINPYNLVDRDDRISINRGFNKIMFCDKHILGC